MTQHLLVPVDGSPASLHAARHAAALSRALGSRVTLLHLTEASDAQTRARLARRLRALAGAFRRRPRLEVRACPDHDIVGAVCAVAARVGCDLIVLGTEGDGHLGDAALAALARQVARASGLAVQLAPRAPGAPRPGPVRA